ncbi:phosphoribosyltransferase family protein [Stutzerimonas marianensis]|uniref:phosphoribosyltransferase family protein n=1 Tax=Stutzerimonas marianensis TaxID=2929513 RepID=UPI003C303BA9
MCIRTPSWYAQRSGADGQVGFLPSGILTRTGHRSVFVNYRSLNHLSQLTNAYAGRIPCDVDLVVGIPRSGMLVASIIALKQNLPLTDLYSFLRNDDLKRGTTRSYKHEGLVKPQDAQKILLVDDSISSAKSMHAALAQVKAIFDKEVVTMAVFAERHNRHLVDVHLELVEQPRVFEWNIMHHEFLKQACLDIDGVLCVDPSLDENDDGQRYRDFLASTRPLFIPSVKVAHLVTSRLEKYRAETEEWLGRNGVEYGTLHMLDLASAEERRRLGIHARFKAEVYAKHPLTRLFVESEEKQAIEIMKLSGKPVYCLETNEMYLPGQLHNFKSGAVRKGYRLKSRLGSKVKAMLGKWLPLSSVTKP